MAPPLPCKFHKQTAGRHCKVWYVSPGTNQKKSLSTFNSIKNYPNNLGKRYSETVKRKAHPCNLESEGCKGPEEGCLSSTL